MSPLNKTEGKRVTFYLGAPSGGVETFVANLTARLPALGWVPSLLVNVAICSHWSSYYRKRGYEVFDLPFCDYEDPNGADYIQNALKQIRADVYVPCYQEIPHSVMPRLKTQFVASILIANGSYPKYLAEIVPYAKHAERIVGVSTTICDLLKAAREVPGDRVRHIPYGVSLAETFPERSLQADGPIRIIYAGRMEIENKQAWRYLELAEILLRKNVDFTLTLLGDGPEYSQMLSTVDTSPALRKHVVMPGGVYPEHVPEYLLKHDVFVLLSDTEGLPLSLLEAMGHGLVPIASDIPSGVAELILSGQNGYLAPIGDLDAAASLIERLHKEHALRAPLARRAYEAVRSEFSIDLMAQRYADLFQEAASMV